MENFHEAECTGDLNNRVGWKFTGYLVSWGILINILVRKKLKN